MKAIDTLVHMSTEKGYVYRTQEAIARAEKYYHMNAVFKTEQEMAKDLMNADVKAIIFVPSHGLLLEGVKEVHDYVSQVVKDYPDVYLGAWASIDPRLGLKGLRELERCFKDLHMVGFVSTAAILDIAPSDTIFYPFYEMCEEANVPVSIGTGMMATGAGSPGGQGYKLKYNHPMYLDAVAADFPALTVIGARVAWPWQDEMIAVLLHKSNVYEDLHGWSPKYFTSELKREINGRLQDRFLFGSAYPLLNHQRLFNDWESGGYKSEVLDKIYFENAKRLFGLKV